MASSAMARVIMAKKMALTRRERKLMNRARTEATTAADDKTQDQSWYMKASRTCQ